MCTIIGRNDSFINQCEPVDLTVCNYRSWSMNGQCTFNIDLHMYRYDTKLLKGRFSSILNPIGKLHEMNPFMAAESVDDLEHTSG